VVVVRAAVAAASCDNVTEELAAAAEALTTHAVKFSVRLVMLTSEIVTLV
jgi:hypothetical protein